MPHQTAVPHRVGSNGQARPSLREARKQAARAAIVAALEELIVERGYAALTMREIAERAGVAYQTLYNYFPSKAQVLMAYVEHVRAPMELKHRPAQQKPLLKHLSDIIHDARNWMAVHDPRLLREIYSATLSGAEEFTPWLATVSAQRASWLSTLFDDAAKRGEFRPGAPVAVLASATVTLMVGFFIRLMFLTDHHASAHRSLTAMIKALLGPHLAKP